MSAVPELTDDEQIVANALHQTMQGSTIETDDLLHRAVLSGRIRRRRQRALTATLAMVVVAVLGAGIALISTHHLVGQRSAEPASPTAAAWPPAVEPGTTDSRIHSRVAALYLARLAGRTPSSYNGIVDQHTLAAALSFDGHASRVTLRPENFDPSVPADERTVAGHDLQLQVMTPQLWDDPTVGPESIFACAKRPKCVLDRGRDQTQTMTWTEPAGNTPIRGSAVITVQHLRTDRSVVIVQGRADTFTVDQLTTMATSPLWDLTVTPSMADQSAAEALQPFANWV